MGRSYQYANDFDKAIEAYGKFKEKAKGNDVEMVDRAIETCNNGKELAKKPVDVKFINLGKNVNSEYSDYYPFCPGDESFLVFTTRRKSPGAMLEYDGYYASDVFISETINGEFQKAKGVSSLINTAESEQCVGLTQDGQSMIIYIDHTEATGDLYQSNRDAKKGFGKTELFLPPVNTRYLESSGSIDMEGQIFLFSSNRPGGQGGLDIYMSKKLPGGTWSEPKNLGPDINTKYDEDFPQLSEDGLTLYFCSKGHYNMGGFDVFKSVYDPFEKSWTKPKNLGFPINTTDDDMHYSPSKTGREAYISAVRDEGLGDLDVYKIIINAVEAPLTAINGSVFLNDTTAYPNNLDVLVVDKISGQNYPGNFKYFASKKKYTLALPAGSYKIIIKAPDCEPFEKNILVQGKNLFKTSVLQDFTLTGFSVPSHTPKSTEPEPPKKTKAVPAKK